MSNYDKMAAMARDIFLGMDAEAMIRRWDLENDSENIYVTYLGQRYAIDRKTAVISLVPGPEDGYVPGDLVNETMVIFDLLTHSETRPAVSGEWESISGLAGIIGSGHDRLLNNEKSAAVFADRAGDLERACARLGRLETGKADVGCVIPVFADLPVWFRFWDRDEEFAAVIKFLFDKNVLAFMHYETLWYLMQDVLDRLSFYAGA